MASRPPRPPARRREEPRPAPPPPPPRPAPRPAAPPPPRPAPRPQARAAPSAAPRRNAPTPRPAQSRPAPRPSAHPSQGRPGGRAPQAHPPGARRPPTAHPARRGPTAHPASLIGPHAPTRRAPTAATPLRSIWARQNQDAADYAHIPRDIMWGVYGIETTFGTNVHTSTASAVGLMQFLRSTAQQYHYPFTNTPTINESQAQFTAGALYLRDLHNRYHDWDTALRHYSGGGYGLADVQRKAGTQAPPLGVVRVSPTTGQQQQAALYVNPLAHAKVRAERIDQGVDYAGTGYLVAIAAAEITESVPDGSGWEGEGYLEYKITQPGELEGAFIYYAEGITPTVHVGDRVHAGERVANLRTYMPHGIELGFAAGHGQESYYRYHDGPYNEHTATRPGIAFSNLIERLGGPGGIIEGTVVGTFPEFIQSGEPAPGVTPTDTGPTTNPVGGGISASGQFDWPSTYLSAFVQLQRGARQGSHHSHAGWAFASGITYVPMAN